MRIYVASKFENQEPVIAAHRLLESDGHVITHDWTAENAAGLEGEEKERYLRVCAEKDRDGVLSADGFLLLGFPRCSGALTELGIAIAGKKFIVIIDRHHLNNIFLHLAEVHHVKDLDEARFLFTTQKLLRSTENVE